MKHGQVTPAFVHPVIPVLYVDLDMEPVNQDEQADEITAAEVCKITAYPSLQAIELTKSGPTGKPVYRIEGPLPVLTVWLLDVHNGDLGTTEAAVQTLTQLRQAKLAS